MTDWNTATYCDDRRCFLHPDGSEHHVEACFAARTFRGQMHHFEHELGEIRDAIVTVAPREMEELWMARTRMGRLTLRLRRAGGKFRARS